MKKKNNNSGIVYSTNKKYFENNDKTEEKNSDTKDQNLKVWIERKGGGKEVTVIKEFNGTEKEVEELSKFLKTKCATGGSIRDGDILIQGNQRDKIIQLLLQKGYKARKAGG